VALGQTGTQKLIRGLLKRLPLKLNVTIIGPFRSLIAIAKSFNDPRNVIREILPVPIDQIPGVVTQVRRKEETKQQTQTPVEEKIEATPNPPEQERVKP
jgi:hypothetical protein